MYKCEPAAAAAAAFSLYRIGKRGQLPRHTIVSTG